MNVMINVYETLRKTQYFVDNEYLKNYCLLVERNGRTPQRGGQTHKHHIIPKSWFKLTGVPVNNTLANLVNLNYRDHTLAHYYLCLCTEDPFRYANELALVCLESRKKLNIIDKHLLHSLPMYNNIYEDYVNKRHSKYKLYK